MSLDRRGFLRLSAMLAMSTAVSGCVEHGRLIGTIASSLTPSPAFSEDEPALSADDHAVLCRLTYGPSLDDRRRMAAIGRLAWIEEQLSHESLDDSATEVRLSAYPSLRMSASELIDLSDKLFDEQDRLTVPAELRQATLMRRVTSRRQVYERTVEFWTDHFSISVDKGDCCYLKTVDDREVIRRHAFGRFSDLLSASAHSPAMLVYLDNQANRSGAPNENYARELMELHTLGIDGGYSQGDVEELARCLTGWTVKDHFWRGQFRFDGQLHDAGVKRLLGRTLEPRGEEEGELVLGLLAEHPSTARHLARKLARRFLRDDPPADLVERTARAFESSNGDVRLTLRTLLLDGQGARRPKIKRPLDFVLSSLRQLQAHVQDARSLLDPLARMGHLPFAWPTPDGFPDTAEPWMTTLIPRWQFAASLARGELAGVRLPIDGLLDAGSGLPGALRLTAGLLFGFTSLSAVPDQMVRALDEVNVRDEHEALQLAVAAWLGSEPFQWH
ncbi:MAG: DUF1800 domain-containing protein [Chloroflexi bacterium]|nr:DUF1800 domain-containing protein [Chloroflexota bacterium]